MLHRLGAFALALTLTAAPAVADHAPGALVDVEAGKVYYETCGQGPKTIVLIHDGVAQSAGFDQVWPILCAHYRVVRYDRRGYGRTPAASGPYAPVDDLAAVMAAAKMDHAALVGASSGGGLAIDFALAHPKAVDALVLVGPDFSGSQYSDRFINEVKSAFATLLLHDNKRAIANITSPKSYVLAPGHDEARKRLAELLLANPQDLPHADPARKAPVARALMPTLKTPTLILVGEFDDPDNHAHAGVAEALIPGADREVVADAGHLIYMDHPGAFSELVERFVDKQR